MIGIGIPISQRRMPRMDFTSISNVSETLAGLTRFHAAHRCFTVLVCDLTARSTRYLRPPHPGLLLSSRTSLSVTRPLC